MKHHVMRNHVMGNHVRWGTAVAEFVVILKSYTTLDAPIPWQTSIQINGMHHCGGSILDER